MLGATGGRGTVAIPTWDFLEEGREPHLPEVLDVGLLSEICALVSSLMHVSPLMDAPPPPTSCFQAMNPFPDSGNLSS